MHPTFDLGACNNILLLLLFDESMYQKVILKEFKHPPNSANFVAVELQDLSDNGDWRY